MTNPNREYWKKWERERRERRSTPSQKANAVLNVFMVAGGLILFSIVIPLLTVLVSMGLFVVVGLAIFSFIAMTTYYIVSPTSGSPKGEDPEQRTTSRNQ